MPRYILIDNNSGYIFGDTADFGAGAGLDDPIDAARRLDQHIGGMTGTYVFFPYNPPVTKEGYHIYRADIDGSEVVPLVWDGQDKDTIDAVTSNCRYVGFVARTDTP